MENRTPFPLVNSWGGVLLAHEVWTLVGQDAKRKPFFAFPASRVPPSLLPPFLPALSSSRVGQSPCVCLLATLEGAVSPRRSKEARVAPVPFRAAGGVLCARWLASRLAAPESFRLVALCAPGRCPFPGVALCRPFCLARVAFLPGGFHASLVVLPSLLPSLPPPSSHGNICSRPSESTPRNNRRRDKLM